MQKKNAILLCLFSISLALYATSTGKVLINKALASINNEAKSTSKARKAWRDTKPVMCNAKQATATILTPMPWSAAATWTSFGSTKPIAGSSVTIPSGVHIMLDESTPALANLTINGTLEFERQDLSLTANWVMVMGALHIGSAAAPFVQKATINLTGTNVNENIMGMGTRGLMIMGGTLELHGTPPTKTWTKINAHAPQGATSLTLMESVNWQVNDQIVVAPTDYYQAGPTENSVSQRVSLNAVSGAFLTTAAGMNAHRWGLMQYATPSGMSLTYSAPPATLVAGTPTQLDERAEVGNLTRNIRIQSPDDALWQNDGFGCHVMVMRQGTTQGVAHVNGIEILRGGQNGKVGRYPFHWHMLSYEGATTLPDATGQYIRNSSVNESAHRGIVIHGTNGVEISKNIIYKVRGHGIFTEDASERRNTIDGNLVLNVRNPVTALKVHETDQERGSAGYWVSNPDNTIINNTAADCGGNGFWFAFTTQTWGLSAGIQTNPSRTLFGTFDNNTTHSNSQEGVFMDLVETDNLGNVGGFKYNSTTDGLDPQWPFPNLRRYTLSRYTTWKNARGGIWNRAVWPDNDQAVSADNCGSFFSGAGDNGLVKRSLVVGTSLNYNMNGMTRPTTFGADVPVAMASYHSAFDLKDNFIVNFPAVANTPSGAFALNDYYLIPVDKGLTRNVNNTLVASHPGVRTLPHEPQFTFAGALWDPHDYWGGAANKDNYYVFDNPFLTYGQTPQIVQPSTATSGGVIVEGPFYGVAEFVINQANSPYSPYMAIDVKRLNSSLATVGTWAVAEGTSGQLLPNMRHFSAHPTGIYELNFPTLANVNDFSIKISNMLTANDYQVVGVEYDGAYRIDGLFASTAYNYFDFGGSLALQNSADTRVYQPVANRQAVINAPVGEVYWQDRTNNKVWFKIRGGLNPGDAGLPAIDDVNLYRSFAVRAYGALAPLPVELLAFEGKYIEVRNPATGGTEGGNLLTWATASEINNKGFGVEKSTDAQRWQSIAFVAGAGTSTKTNHYQWLDKSSVNGTNYYRLKQTDNDGKTKFSNTVSLANGKTSTLIISPNPTKGIINVNGIEAGKAIITDLLGRRLKEVQINNALRLDISDLPNGVYYLKIEFDKQSEVKMIVKE